MKDYVVHNSVLEVRLRIQDPNWWLNWIRAALDETSLGRGYEAIASDAELSRLALLGPVPNYDKLKRWILIPANKIAKRRSRVRLFRTTHLPFLDPETTIRAHMLAESLTNQNLQDNV